MRLNVSSHSERRPQGSSESGQALPVVMTIVFIVVLLSVALITRVNGDFKNTNLESKTQQARALAQSGVADAMFQIDQQGASPSSFCNEPNSSTFTVPGVTVTNGSPAATVASGGFPSVHPAEGVSGTGLAAGTVVRAVVGNALTLSQSATSSATVTLTFSTCLSSIPGAPGTVYTARYNSSTGAYTVFSKGTTKNITYAVQATVTNNPILVDGVVGGTVTFNGNSQTDVNITDAYGRCVTAAPCSGTNPGATVGIGVTAGGTLTCHGPSDPNATYVNYGGTISSCTPFKNVGPIYYPQPPSQTCPPPLNPYGAQPTPCMLPLTTATPPGPTLPCTSMSPAVSGSDAAGYTVTGSATAASAPTLEPGIYSCRGGLTMTKNVNIDYSSQTNGGRVEIYVFPAVGSTKSPTVSFGGSTVNACETIGSGVGQYEPATCNGGLVGDPTDLQIYAGGGNTDGLADLGNSNVDAIFWGPTMDLTLTGASDNLTWTGAVVLGTITANGAVSFSLNFDQRLESEYQVASWQISNYLETSPNFSIP
jgi:Tfp pilus assembly protein PilX